MANSLGEIAVQLTLNSAQFLSGFGAAGAASKRFRSELSSSIEGIGGALEGVLGKFGEFGEVIARTIGSATQAASSAVVSFGRMGGAIGTIAGIGAGAAAAILSVDAGAIGLAIHTAESAARLGEMAQKAGVSSEALAGLSLSGKKVGVDVEGITKALAFLNSNMVKAAIAPEGTKNAFTRMGVEVKDAGGKMRDTSSVFLDVVSKLSALPQPEQGFIVKQLFGKGGVEILPLINQGIDEINKNTAEAKGFGLGDPATVAASQKFKETVVDIGAEFEGLTLRLTKDLLPALQFMAEKLVTAFETGQAQAFIDKIAEIVKGTLLLGFAIAHLPQISLFGNVQAGIDELQGAIGIAGTKTRQTVLGLLSLTTPGANTEFFKKQNEDAAKAISAASGEIARNVNRDLSGISWDKYVSDVDKFKKGLEGKPKGAFGFDEFKEFMGVLKPKTGDFDLSKTKEDTTLARIKERIAALVREAAEWVKVAAAGTQAEILIAEAVKKGDEEFGKLKTEAAKDKTGKAQALVSKDEGVIKAAGAESVFGAATKALTADLDKQKEKLDEQGKAAIALGEAYKVGGAAIASAAINQLFAEQSAKLNALRESLPLATQKWGAASQVVKDLASNITKLNNELERDKAAERAKLTAVLTTSLNEQSGAYAALKPSIDSVSAAYLQGEQALRAARIELEIQKFKYDELTKGLVVNQAQIAQKRKILEDADRQAHTDSIQQAAAQFDLNLQYSEEIRRLGEIREALQAVGASTLLVDAAEFDAQGRMLHQWDEAAIKVGTFGEKVRGVFGELVLQGRNAGGQIAQGFLTAVDGIESQFAKLATGQKANFKQVFQNLGETIAKAEIQKTVGNIAGKLGISLPAGKPDGSSANNALWVRLTEVAGLGGIAGGGGPLGSLGGVFGKGGLGGIFGGALGGGEMTLPTGGGSRGGFLGGLLGVLGSIFGKGSLPFSAGALGAPSAISGVTGATGSAFSFGPGGLAGLFPGLAGGGDMVPGRWYVTGEEGTELVKGPGTVIPHDKIGSQSDNRQTNITNHFHGFKDTDMFRRSESQLTQAFHRQLSIANAR